jgi:biotin carboxyl carrier protein
MNEVHLDERSYKIRRLADGVEINGQALKPEIRRNGERQWHIILGGRSYEVFVQALDPAARSITLSVQGKTASLQQHSREEQLLRSLGMERRRSQKVDVLKAPMPGLIQAVKVAEGDVVKKGDTLLILEAMKMENLIKSPGDGVVARVHVQEKESVEKNHVLITFQ